jgi:ATPase subunit of ABC transporter with duplicated ATPase domains
VRARLGRYGISGEQQGQVMETLSDGIKSRVVLALMAHRSPHILLLDEPTNNLDIESIDALAEGLKLFEGGVVLVIDMVAHTRSEYRTTMGHEHLGFGEKEMRELAAEAKLTLSLYRPLRPAIEARGPGLFAARLEK